MRRKQPFALVTVASFTSLGLLLATPLWAWDGVVEKQTFEMESFTTQGGETIGTSFRPVWCQLFPPCFFNLRATIKPWKQIKPANWHK